MNLDERHHLSPSPLPFRCLPAGYQPEKPDQVRPVNGGQVVNMPYEEQAYPGLLQNTPGQYNSQQRGDQ